MSSCVSHCSGVADSGVTAKGTRKQVKPRLGGYSAQLILGSLFHALNYNHHGASCAKRFQRFTPVSRPQNSGYLAKLRIDKEKIKVFLRDIKIELLLL